MSFLCEGIQILDRTNRGKHPSMLHVSEGEKFPTYAFAQKTAPITVIDADKISL